MTSYPLYPELDNSCMLLNTLLDSKLICEMYIHLYWMLGKNSLIKILKYDDDVIVTMHDLIQYMGKEIVWQQSTWPDKHNMSWFHKDIIHIFEVKKKGMPSQSVLHLFLYLL